MDIEAEIAAQLTPEDRLIAHCRAFISAQQISCAETIYQMDKVIENAYEFIEGVCDIVGYVENDDV